MQLQFNYKIHILEYPVIGVSVLGYILWLGAIYMRLVYNTHYIYTIPLSILGVYTLFTPLHEAVHSNISSNKIINNIIGNIVIIPFFFSNFDTFKFIHLEHHRHTNIEGKDPDHFSRHGCISCICMPIHYYIYYCSIIYEQGVLNNNILYIMSVYFLLYISYVYNILNDLLVVWVVPSIFAVGLLSYIFDYLPHRNHTDIDNPTKMTDGCIHLNNGRGNDIISYVTCNQLTYHHVHHLYSRLPFHIYKQFWDSNYSVLHDTYETQTIF